MLVSGSACKLREHSNADRYERLYGIYRELYPATRTQMHALAEIQIAGAGG